MSIINKINIFRRKKPKSIIDKIEEIRSENNKNWMDLLRLAKKYAPEEAKEIFNKIIECDIKISRLMKEI